MIKHSRIFLISIFVLTIEFVFSQNGDFVIGMENDSIIVLNLGDVVLESPANSSESFVIDIDDNNEWDIKFISFLTWSGPGGGGGIEIYSQDSTFFSIDTVAYQLIGPCDDEYLDTISWVVAEKLNIGDTINSRVMFDNFATITSRHVGNDPCYTYKNIIHWIDSTRYIGFKKSVNNKIYYGWIKVEVQGAGRIVLKKLAITDYTLSTSMNTEYPTCLFFPNPARDKIQLSCDPKIRNVEIKIFNQIGKLLHTEKLDVNEIDISQYKPGIYFIVILQDSKTYRHTLIIQ